MIYLQLKKPLELFVKRRKFLPGSRFLSRRDMTYMLAIESDVNPIPSFLPLILRWIHVSGLVWSLYKCAALWRAVYDLSTTEKTLVTIREEKEISSWFRISISSQYDRSC